MLLKSEILMIFCLLKVKMKDKVNIVYITFGINAPNPKKKVMNKSNKTYKQLKF